MLGIAASYYCMKFRGKRIIQTQENGKEPHFGHVDCKPFPCLKIFENIFFMLPVITDYAVLLAARR